MSYDFHIFCCVNERPASAVRECCKKKNALELRTYMKKNFRFRVKKIRVNQSGCLDKCEEGPVLVIYPDGTWYNYKNTKDIDEIIKKHIQEGKKVTRLLIK